MAYQDALQDIVYLTLEDYLILISTGSVTIKGDTLTYDPNTVYFVPGVDIPAPPTSGSYNLQVNNGLLSWVPTGPEIAPAYSASATYEVGDAVIYDYQLYQCISAISTPEAWTPAHWQQTTVIDCIKSSIDDAIEGEY